MTTLIDTPAAHAGKPAVRYRAATLASAARSALQWRLLALWAVVLLLPTALSALPVWQLLSSSLDHSVHAAALATRLDLNTLSDLLVANQRAGTGIGNGNLLALLLTLLLSPLLAGMTIHAARAARAPHVGELLAGGLQEYGRLLRMLVWAVVPLGVAAALAAIAFGAGKGYAERAILETEASHAHIVAMCVAFLFFAIADASLDAGRAVLASDRRRKSAVKAWWAGFRLLVKRPFATLGTWMAITLVGLALAGLLALVRLNVPALGLGGFVAAFLLTQLAVVVLAWMRSARLFAMLELVRSVRT